MLDTSISSKLMLYKYTVADLIVLYSDGKTDIIKEMNVTSINIEKDFDNDLFPIMNVNVVINRELYKKIVCDKDKVRIKVTLNKFAVKPTEETLTDKPKFVEPVISDVFNIVIDDTDLDLFKRMQDKKFNDEIKPVEEGNGLDKTNTELNLFLFKPHALDLNKHLDNYIFQNSDVITPIVFFANECGVKKLLISPPDNINNYHQIIVPDYKFSSIIDNIHQMYGIYNTGYVLFYDFDILYLVNKSRHNISISNNELPLIYLFFGEYGEGVNRRMGSYVDKENNRYFINCTSIPHFSEVGGAIKETTYNKILAVNTGDKTNSSDSVNLGGRNIDSTKVLDNKYNNSFLINSNLYAVEESNYMVAVELPEIDFEKCTPNKQYSLWFDTYDYARAQKYNGTYRLTKIVTDIHKNGSEKFLEARSIGYFKSSKE